jgi:hypothetical protein
VGCVDDLLEELGHVGWHEWWGVAEVEVGAVTVSADVGGGELPDAGRGDAEEQDEGPGEADGGREGVVVEAAA